MSLMVSVGMRSSLLFAYAMSMVFCAGGAFGSSGGRRASTCTCIFVFGGAFSNFMMIPLKGFCKAYIVNPVESNNIIIMIPNNLLLKRTIFIILLIVFLIFKHNAKNCCVAWFERVV